MWVYVCGVCVHHILCLTFERALSVVSLSIWTTHVSFNVNDLAILFCLLQFLHWPTRLLSLWSSSSSAINSMSVPYTVYYYYYYYYCCMVCFFSLLLLRSIRFVVNKIKIVQKIASGGKTFVSRYRWLLFTLYAFHLQLVSCLTLVVVVVVIIVVVSVSMAKKFIELFSFYFLCWLFFFVA